MLGGAKLQFQFLLNLLVRELLCILVVVAVAGKGALPNSCLSQTGETHGYFRAFVFIQCDGIDVCIEVVVVRAERIENIPNNRERLVIIKSFLGAGAFGYNHGDNDVAVFLLITLPSVERTHHTPYALHYIDLRVASRKEEHSIKCRHIYPFGQTAHIAYNTALLRIVRVCRKPSKSVVTLCSSHRAIHMACKNMYHLRFLCFGQTFVVNGRNLWQYGGDVFGGAGFVCLSYLMRKGKSAVHQSRVGLPSNAFVAQNLFGQAVDDANQTPRIVVVQLLGIGVFYLLHQFLGYHILRNGEDQYFIVGQNAILNGIREVHTMELFAVNGLVIHRAENAIVFACLDLGTLAIEAGSGRHIESLVSLNKIVVVDFCEAAFVLRRELHSRGAVCFVADNEIEDAKLSLRFFEHGSLCFGYNVNALIGREYHR